MSDYELTTFNVGGELAPISPSLPLAPSNDGWDIPAPDELTDYSQHANTSPKIFGSDLPAGTTMQMAEQRLDQIADVFRADAAKMRLDSALVDAAITWFKANALLPVGHVEKRHRYDLTGYSIPKSDRDAVTSFLNFMDRHGAPQRFVSSTLWWLSQISKQSQQQQPTPGEISDAEWDQIERRAEQDRQAGENELRTRWGFQFASNLRIVKRYFDGLSAIERAHFENALLPGGQLALNNADVIEMLYRQAIGVNNIPKDDLVTEIASIEAKMGTREYLKNEAMQARYRYLIDIRNGGN